MHIAGVRIENVRVFEGEHLVPVSRGLTVLIGRNNAGKSTVLRAPFMLDGGGDGVSRGAFQRLGSEEGSVALCFSLSPSECTKELGFDPASLRHFRGTGPQGRLDIARRSEFTGWMESPLVEVGFRWGPQQSAIARLVSQNMRDYAEVSSKKCRVVLDGRAHEMNVAASTFAGALGFYPAAAQGERAGPLLSYWEHHCIVGSTGWIVGPGRRLRDSDEAQLQESLTFLRLKHPRHFDGVQGALQRAFPELGALEFLETQRTGFGYRPAFTSRTRANRLLARESIGSGAWAYLCMLTAARAAKATGALLLCLDEPHLYMHPGLERLLLDELLEPAHWDGAPLQIIAATHSPTFVNYAVERGTLNVLDWKDESRNSAHIQTIQHDDADARWLGSLVAEPGDILYAESVVFVEGPSDVSALRILARDRCGVRRSVRYVPLRETDKIAPDIARFFSVVVQAGGAGAHTRALLVLDADKKVALEARWKKLQGTDDPGNTPRLEVVWSGLDGNDLESLFCDSAFLVAYFASLGVDATRARTAITDALAGIDASGAKQAKGSRAIRSLHASLLGANDSGSNKADDLENLVRFYISKLDDVVTESVRRSMKPIEDALRKLDGQVVTT